MQTLRLRCGCVYRISMDTWPGIVMVVSVDVVDGDDANWQRRQRRQQRPFSTASCGLYIGRGDGVGAVGTRMATDDTTTTTTTHPGTVWGIALCARRRLSNVLVGCFLVLGASDRRHACANALSMAGVDDSRCGSVFVCLRNADSGSVRGGCCPVCLCWSRCLALGLLCGWLR